MSFYAQEQFLTLDQRLALTAGVTAERSTNNGDINKYYAYPKYARRIASRSSSGSWTSSSCVPRTGVSGTDPNYGVRYTGFNDLTLQHDAGATGCLHTDSSSNDPNIKPETNTEIETGFDATMFKSRAQFGFTVYQKRISSLLLQARSRRARAHDAQWFNGGQFTNKGIEMSLAVTPIQMRKGLTWMSTGLHAQLQQRGLPAGPGVRAGASVRRLLRQLMTSAGQVGVVGREHQFHERAGRPRGDR